MAAAQRLGMQAVQHSLEAAGIQSAGVDDFLVISCTGIDTPGLDLRMTGLTGMRPNLKRATILGMGC
jgi:alkylresorcinol/alkylpyrone synthase